MNVELPPNMTIRFGAVDPLGIQQVTLTMSMFGTTIGAEFNIDTLYPEPVQRRAVIDAVSKLWGHELAEWFKIDGRHVVEPHPTDVVPSRSVDCVQPIR